MLAEPALDLSGPQNKSPYWSPASLSQANTLSEHVLLALKAEGPPDGQSVSPDVLGLKTGPCIVAGYFVPMGGWVSWGSPRGSS